MLIFFQLIPLLGFITVGMGGAGLYVFRLANQSPDVRYSHYGNILYLYCIFQMGIQGITI